MVDNADFIKLKEIVKSRGLLEKQPWVYVGVVAFQLGLFALSLSVLFTVESFWLQMCNAVFLGVVLSQFGITTHSMCHRHCFRKQWQNDLGAILMGNFLFGTSRDWWTQKHNAHHAHPNREGKDPDLWVPLVSFTMEHAQSRRGLDRALGVHQAWIFIGLLFLNAYGLRDASVRYLLTGKARQPRLEGLLLVLNVVWVFSVPILALGLWSGLAFTLVSQVVFGVYLGALFAPNHKGMRMLAADTPIDYLRLQVTTARNVRSHPLVDICYGGLNFQIEHHLFPSMPIHRMREVSKIVKEFCAQRGVPYAEATLFQSFREIFAYLDEIGQSMNSRTEEAPNV